MKTLSTFQNHEWTASYRNRTRTSLLPAACGIATTSGPYAIVRAMCQTEVQVWPPSTLTST